MTESDLYGPIILQWSRGDTRLFRSNSGMAWQGRVLEHSATRLVLAYPRAIKVGCPGMSDITGWSRGGLYTAIEVKSAHGRITDEQGAFLGMVRAHGGRAGIARSVEDVGRIITGRGI